MSCKSRACMNTLLLDALQCQNANRPPVWLMRQAGRFLPEYRKLRSKHSFIEMYRHPELIAEITQMPLKRFGMDAAILFSDILVIPDALGLGLRFEDKIGPIIERPIQSKVDIEKLPSPSIPDALQYVAEGIKLLLPQLKVPLIGFSGAPFTVASYMIEGGSSKDLRKTKKWMLQDPEGFHLLLNKIASLTIDYLTMQIKAGVQVLQIFDSWANFLAHRQFREFSLAYMQKILEGIQDYQIPVILYCRGSSVFAQDLMEAKPAGISLDWNIDITKIRQNIPYPYALQGNLDPDILYSSHVTIQTEVKRILMGMHGDQGYIFNLGHGILPDIPLDAVKVLVDTVQAQST